MNMILTIKRPFIWLRRFRHRCGYGVHSPFAFDLITNVIYEKTPYYSYHTLAERVQKMKKNERGTWLRTPLKVNRLLFRLANRIQPQSIVHVGVSSASCLYLKAGCKSASHIDITKKELATFVPTAPIDFLYLDTSLTSIEINEACQRLLPYMSTRGICVVGGVRYSHKRLQCWKKWENNEQTGISFDLYDVGLFFFDKTKIKQHYIVNF